MNTPFSLPSSDQTLHNGFSRWKNTSAVRVEDETYADLIMGTGGAGNPTVMRLFTGWSWQPIDDVRVTGLEVQIKVARKFEPGRHRIMMGLATGSNGWQYGKIKGKMLDTDFRVETFGGDGDLFGATTLHSEVVNDSSFGIFLFARSRSIINHIMVKWLKLRVYYEAKEKAILVTSGGKDSHLAYELARNQFEITPVTLMNGEIVLNHDHPPHDGVTTIQCSDIWDQGNGRFGDWTDMIDRVSALASDLGITKVICGYHGDYGGFERAYARHGIELICPLSDWNDSRSMARCTKRGVTLREFETDMLGNSWGHTEVI